MSSLVAMMMTGTKMRKANPPRFCNAATIPLQGVSSLILFSLFATGVVDTGGKFTAGVLKILVAIHPCC
jgi:hypothetical protein